MQDREEILAQLRRNRPANTPLPVISLPVDSLPVDSVQQATPASLQHAFSTVVEEIGGKVLLVEKAAGANKETGPNKENVIAALRTVYPELQPTFLSDLAGQDDLSGLQLFVCEGTLGVAENGAVWVTEVSMSRREAPFITQHLALILDRSQIVLNMHEAYKRISVAEEGFGVFVAGPSKTADIEQSLVLGAHGPRSLTVVLI
ncbi:MAG: lactate utilization protein C [Rhodothermales bacterium]